MQRNSILSDLRDVLAEQIPRARAGAFEPAGDEGEPQISIERHEDHGQRGDGRVNQPLGAALRSLRHLELLGKVLTNNEKLNWLSGIIAKHRRDAEDGKVAAVLAPQHPFGGVAVHRTAGQSFDHVVGGCAIG